MRINRVKISNFRNICGVSVWLNEQCSYIVGGNNIGKTNFLALLRKICEGQPFEPGDFYDRTLPIEISVDTDGGSVAFCQSPGGNALCGRRMNVSFIEIESAAAGRGGEREDGGIYARLLEGGTRHNALASMNLLAKIGELYEDRSFPFEQRLKIDAEGRQTLPLVLAVDEPEVHLHPYMQRSLINHYKRLLGGGDREFSALLGQLFKIDGISGQLVVVTHSTDALVGDFRNLIRFHREGGKTTVISGSNPGLRFSADSEKHMIMRFPEIKEAFYANCALLIEGETEYGCMAAFAEKMGVSLDDLGICLINARGEGSIRPLRQLLSAFSVPTVAIFDGDVQQGKPHGENEFYTSELCFEIEIISTLMRQNLGSLALEIVGELDKKAAGRYLGAGFAAKHFKKMGLSIKGYRAKRLRDLCADDKLFLPLYSAWLMSRKGVMLGRIIGQLLPERAIPNCYRAAILRAKAVALHTAKR